MTHLRTALGLSACVILSGCFLMSEVPRFDDSQSVALLGPETTTFASYDLEGTEWKISETPLITVTPVGSHYLLHDPTGSGTTEDEPILHFVALDDSHWLMQLTAAESANETWAYFSVATWDGHDLLVQPIACDDLHDRPGIADLVTFDENDCTLRPPATGAAPDFPPVLWQDLPPATTKLVLQP